jgi:hypothetical protein|tara:strand:- start:444 stop:626 length:183 start_codon:yes stop_codon:yes gene_type:complete
MKQQVTTKEHNAQVKAEYYRKNKDKFRQWAAERYHKVNPSTPEAIEQRILELQVLLSKMK